MHFGGGKVINGTFVESPIMKKIIFSMQYHRLKAKIDHSLDKG